MYPCTPAVPSVVHAVRLKDIDASGDDVTLAHRLIHSPSLAVYTLSVYSTVIPNEKE